jgi:hypothetical protein
MIKDELATFTSRSWRVIRERANNIDKMSRISERRNQ